MPNVRALMTFVFLTAIGIATTTAKNAPSEPHGSNGREVTSLKKSKKETLGQTKASLHNHTHKLRGPLSASIQMASNKPENAGDVFSLRGLVESTVELQKIDFQWSLPEGVEVVSGEIQGQLDSVSPDSPKELIILLKTLSGENHRIHFVVKGSEKNSSFADSAQYNTLHQERINESKRELLKSTEAYAEQVQKTKIFH